MPRPTRGEVWIADLGLAAKVRPVLVLSIACSDRDYDLVTVVPHTTSPRGAASEVSIPARCLKEGAFNAQGILAVPRPKLIRRIGGLLPDQMALVESTVKKWLGLEP